MLGTSTEINGGVIKIFPAQTVLLKINLVIERLSSQLGCKILLVSFQERSNILWMKLWSKVKIFRHWFLHEKISVDF
jgi:hypothetical protein